MIREAAMVDIQMAAEDLLTEVSVVDVLLEETMHVEVLVDILMVTIRCITMEALPTIACIMRT
jgi:hypothetical protein